MLQQTLRLLLFLPLVAQAAIFPEHIGTFDKGSPASLSMPDRDLLNEFGLEATEQADYKSDSKHFTATAWRFHDATGAMAFFQAHRPSGATPAPVVKLTASTSDGSIFAFGNYVFQFTGAVPPATDLAPVYAQLPKLEQSPLPALISFLPSAGLIPNSERYVLGPVSLDRFEPRVAPSIAAFHLGAEGQIGKYKSPKGPLSLAIFNYPTPNMARERLLEFQKIPGAMAKRAGPLVAVTIDPPDLDSAERLLAQVKYETNLTWSQKVPTNEVKGFARTLINIFVLAGIILGMCLVAGVAFGGFKILARKMGRRVDPDAMITLGLDGK
ncbi:MAG TPA: DUF6599 family protein [Bryobacteraceae bacterium]|jgi:hypothetical protein|nr:DUF6599 family protein [Bryobacteraceae bacterium]